MNQTDIHTTRELLRRHGIQLTKGWGQNFLIDPTVCPRMAQLCGADADTGVLEIGPGAGALTRALAVRAKKVVAMEIDRRLEPVLDETLAGLSNVEVVWDDFMKVHPARLLDEWFGDMPVIVCANLPYYITSPIVMKLLEEYPRVNSVTVMVQKEAADRLCAPMGTRQAGSVTAAVAMYAQSQQLFFVPRDSFLPPPKVDSAVIRLNRHNGSIDGVPDGAEQRRFVMKVVRAGFGQRRKTLANALSAGLARDKGAVAAALEAAGVKPTARAEELTLAQFATVAGHLGQEPPRRPA